MTRNTRQRPAEAEAVGQENISACLPKGLFKIAVAVKYVSEKRFGGGDVDVAVFIRRTGDVPPAVGNVFFKLFEKLGVVFLHQLIAVGAFKVETVIVVFLK